MQEYMSVMSKFVFPSIDAKTENNIFGSSLLFVARPKWLDLSMSRTPSCCKTYGDARAGQEVAQTAPASRALSRDVRATVTVDVDVLQVTRN